VLVSEPNKEGRQASIRSGKCIPEQRWAEYVCVHSSGICPPDAITFDYVQQRTDAPFEAVHADAGASYVEEYRFDVSKIEPLVAAPHSPDNRKKAAECSNVNIDRVYIG
jgi:homoaconitase/3-isopropylmalate dehydratase large subunit